MKATVKKGTQSSQHIHGRKKELKFNQLVVKLQVLNFLIDAR